MASSRPIRVLHLPFNIAGNAYGLSRGEISNGLQSYCVCFDDTFMGVPADLILMNPGDGAFRRELKKWRLFFWSLRRFDVFHFNFGQKFFPLGVRFWKRGESAPQKMKRILYAIYSCLVGGLDLFVLKYLGKKMFMTWQGDDARQGDFAAANYPIHFVGSVDSNYYDPSSDRRKRRSIQIFHRYCAGMFALNPDLLNVLPRGTRFLPYAHLNLSDWKPILAPRNKRPKIVHAPSHRGVKGTSHLLNAADRLRARGYDFELLIIEGLAHSEARKIYEGCDLLVDQLLAGWYGGLAVELMALGKPVVCYLRREDFHFIPKQMITDLPIIEAEPSTIEQTLADLLDRVHDWPEMGARSRAFVEKWHDPVKVAAAVVQDYKDVLSTDYNCS